MVDKDKAVKALECRLKGLTRIIEEKDLDGFVFGIRNYSNVFDSVRNSLDKREQKKYLKMFYTKINDALGGNWNYKI